MQSDKDEESSNQGVNDENPINDSLNHTSSDHYNTITDTKVTSDIPSATPSDDNTITDNKVTSDTPSATPSDDNFVTDTKVPSDNPSATPSDDNFVTEGRASIKSPQNVFYNPVQQFNRDLSVLVASRLSQHFCQRKPIRRHQAEVRGEGRKVRGEVGKVKDEVEKGIRILEALAATGLRSVRFALEVPDVACVVANDYDQKAVAYIRHNAQLNQVSHIITPNQSDAALYMHLCKGKQDRFHMVDLDPYGSPTPFLDSAVQCVAEEGLLCVTSTDMAVLCGNSPETCLSKYACVSVRTRFCHEMAVRILLRSIECHANRYSRYIIPLLSISVDFYCRVFVQVRTSQKEVKHSATKLSHLYHCSSCSNHHLQPLCTKVATSHTNYKFVASSAPDSMANCQNCGGRMVMAGPIWSEAIHDRAFVGDLLEGVGKRKGEFETEGRVEGMMQVVVEELEDVALYYDSDHLCSVLHCTCISFISFRSALLNGGYRVSSSHAARNSVKTDAPPHVVWDIMRCFVLENPISINRNPEGSTAHHILSQPIKFVADFTPHPLANPESRVKGMLRWQVNPQKYWGPKAKATRVEKKPDVESGSKKNKKQRKREYLCKRVKLSECSFGTACVYKHQEE